MERRIYDNRYWDGRSGFEPLRAVLDDRDRPGRKNRYIDVVQKLALGEWYPGGSRVLDLGCGAGRLLGWLSEKSPFVVGLDISEGMLRAAGRQGGKRPFVLYDGGRLPFRDEAFSAIVSVGVFQDLIGDEEYQALLAETVRCMEPGGGLYLIEQVSDGPNRPWRGLDEVTRACQGAGLAVERRRPVRKGRWWLLYLIRFGMVPPSLLERAARWELRLREREPSYISYYMDYLIELRKV